MLWKEVEKEIVEQLSVIKKLCGYVDHPVLMRFKARSIQYKLRTIDDLQIKQDFFCIDAEATILTEPFQLGLNLFEMCKKQIKKAQTRVTEIIKSSEFLPQYFEIDPFDQ